ncbi:response regulator [Corallincola luteus]|uniref:Response regulator n=1 Tax=Corallincola luteus TaxID=1775177 RepID=A0ABY2AP00_9GAMM|nr:response regulator [Corallincola luteus]TCI04924.1 response regulator [Corallincola luteus]
MKRILNFLIADDNYEKRQDLSDLVSENFVECNIDFSESFNSTSKMLREQTYDLVLLDMSMPSFDPRDGKSKSPVKALAGKDLMLKMRYRGISFPVIVVTQFDIFGRHSDAVGIDKLVDDLRDDFPDNFIGCVFYNTQSKSWKQELLDMISGVVNG